jgi:hypothetical protein
LAAFLTLCKLLAGACNCSSQRERKFCDAMFEDSPIHLNTSTTLSPTSPASRLGWNNKDSNPISTLRRNSDSEAPRSQKPSRRWDLLFNSGFFHSPAPSRTGLSRSLQSRANESPGPGALGAGLPATSAAPGPAGDEPKTALNLDRRAAGGGLGGADGTVPRSIGENEGEVAAAATAAASFLTWRRTHWRPGY